MYKNKLALISLVFLLSACGSGTETSESADTAENKATTPETTSTLSAGDLNKEDENAKIAYAMGANSGHFLAKNLPEFKSWGMEFDEELIKKGFIESLGQKSQMDEQEIQTVLMAFQQQIQVKLQEISEQQAAVAAEANKLYLDANAKKEGVVVTESGLQYKIISEGSGDAPKATDTVVAHYRGTLVDGKEFDSSYSRNQPQTFPLNGVIAGWTEGLQLIKTGGKIELVIPPELGYGTRALPDIPANSVLLFEVELVEIVKQDSGKTE